MDESKAILKMMESFPKDTPIPKYIIVNDTCFHEDLIKYQQKHYTELLEKVCTLNKELDKANEEVESLKMNEKINERIIDSIMNMKFLTKLKFLFLHQIKI
jgi:hypothetical protein